MLPKNCFSQFFFLADAALMADYNTAFYADLLVLKGLTSLYERILNGRRLH
jgi:hypothetical protein